ncbi:MAG: hypothetical protein ACI9WC_000533 [Arenicella sp.]|jgi:hypothetical protein
MDKAKYMVFLRNPIDESLKVLLNAYIVNQSGLEFIFQRMGRTESSFI